MSTTFVAGIAANESVPTTTLEVDPRPATAPLAVETFVPKTLRLATLSSSAYRLRQHLELELSVRDGKALVRWNAGAIEAEGDVLTDAVARFQAALVSRATEMPDLIEIIG